MFVISSWLLHQNRKGSNSDWEIDSLYQILYPRAQKSYVIKLKWFTVHAEARWQWLIWNLVAYAVSFSVGFIVFSSPFPWCAFFMQMTVTTTMTARATSTRTPPTTPATPETTLFVGGWTHSVSPRLASSTEHLDSTLSCTPWTTIVGSLSTHDPSIGRKSVLFLSGVLMILPWNITFSGSFGSQTSLLSVMYSTVRAHSQESVNCRTIWSVTSDNFSRESSCCMWRVENKHTALNIKDHPWHVMQRWKDGRSIGDHLRAYHYHITMLSSL